MTYFEHMKANWKVALRGRVLSFFHFIHGIIPSQLTDHEYWNINFRKN